MTYVSPNSKVRTVTMMGLFASESEKLSRRDGLKWHDIHTEFHENQSVSQSVSQPVCNTDACVDRLMYTAR